MKWLLKLFHGGVSSAPSGAIDLNKVWGAIRTGLVVWAAMEGLGTCECMDAEGLSFIEALKHQLEHVEMGSDSTWVAGGVAIIDLIRRVTKDYAVAPASSKKPVRPPQPSQNRVPPASDDEFPGLDGDSIHVD